MVWAESLPQTMAMISYPTLIEIISKHTVMMGLKGIVYS